MNIFSFQQEEKQNGFPWFGFILHPKNLASEQTSSVAKLPSVAFYRVFPPLYKSVFFFKLSVLLSAVDKPGGPVNLERKKKAKRKGFEKHVNWVRGG